MADDAVEASDSEPPSFDPAVAQSHTHLTADDYEDLYVVGDVHGCLAELRTLWDRLAPGPEDRVVFVGDLVRKGPDSRGVVEFVAGRDEAVSVRGNNEAKVLAGEVSPDWAGDVRETIAAFPLVVSWDDAMAVHGGVHPEWAFHDHDPGDLLEMRAVPRGNSYDGPFWFESYAGPPRVFFGHTVLHSALVDEWAVGLDTGCVYGGALTAYDCRRDCLVSVEAERTYQDRTAEKVVDPSATSPGPAD